MIACRTTGASLFLVSAPLVLGGCVAQAAIDVVTLPVRVASKTVDLATTSQSEADEARGREIRRREGRLGELERNYAKLADRCAKGHQKACDDAQAAQAEMNELLPSIPLERGR